MDHHGSDISIWLDVGQAGRVFAEYEKAVHRILTESALYSL